MNTHYISNRIGISLIKSVYLFISLTAILSACQTSGSRDQQNSVLAMHDAQKEIVRNALDTGKPESVIETMRTMVREHPNDPETHSLMGFTQLALKNPLKAVKHFKLAYKLKPDVATGLNLSSALIEASDTATASKILPKLVKIAEKENYRYKERIFHNLGYAAIKQKDLKKAESWFKTAIEENPAFFPSHLELARIYEQAKKPAEAIASYRRASDYCLICFEPVDALAKIYTQLGRHAEAKKILIQFTKQEGISPVDREHAQSSLASIFTEKNKTQPAKEAM